MIIPEGINTKEFYMILSSVTDKPYLGDDMSVFCFEKKADGMKFIEEHKSTKMGFKPMVIIRPYLRDLFLSAVANVNIKTEDGRQISIPLSQKDFRDHLGNEKAVKNLMLLKQTGIKKYLRNLKECDFYMPVHIDIRTALRTCRHVIIWHLKLVPVCFLQRLIQLTCRHPAFFTTFHALFPLLLP